MIRAQDWIGVARIMTCRGFGQVFLGFKCILSFRIKTDLVFTRHFDFQKLWSFDHSCSLPILRFLPTWNLSDYTPKSLCHREWELIFTSIKYKLSDEFIWATASVFVGVVGAIPCQKVSFFDFSIVFNLHFQKLFTWVLCYRLRFGRDDKEIRMIQSDKSRTNMNGCRMVDFRFMDTSTVRLSVCSPL